MKQMFRLMCATAFVVMFAPACGKKAAEDNQAPAKAPDTGQEQATPAEQAPARQLKGVDMDKRIIYIGALNAESGPAASVGKPFAFGKRLLSRHINAGNSGLLPEGWKVELVERDHAYNPQQAVQQYNAIRDQVLFIATSFGTPNTLPLRASLERDNLVAFPASLSSQMAEHEFTPPIGPAYTAEAQRAMDWVMEREGSADKIKAGIVYQEDDYGKDGMLGWRKAAEHHGVQIVAEKTIAPGQKDFTAVITALKEAGASYVYLTLLPSSTGPLLGTAAQLQYSPTWIGSTPTWLDVYFSKDVMPPEVFEKYYLATGIPYWGEDVPGMDAFLKAWETHGKDLGNPDWYILLSYATGLAQIEALRRAIENGDVSREGYKKALHSVSGWDAGGLWQPLDFSKVPYEVSKRIRILKPVMDKRTWEVVAGYAEPSSMAAK